MSRAGGGGGGRFLQGGSSEKLLESSGNWGTNPCLAREQSKEHQAPQQGISQLWRKNPSYIQLNWPHSYTVKILFNILSPALPGSATLSFAFTRMSFVSHWFLKSPAFHIKDLSAHLLSLLRFYSWFLWLMAAVTNASSFCQWSALSSELNPATVSTASCWKHQIDPSD